MWSTKQKRMAFLRTHSNNRKLWPPATLDPLSNLTHHTTRLTPHNSHLAPHTSLHTAHTLESSQPGRNFIQPGKDSNQPVRESFQPARNSCQPNKKTPTSQRQFQPARNTLQPARNTRGPKSRWENHTKNIEQGNIPSIFFKTAKDESTRANTGEMVSSGWNKERNTGANSEAISRANSEQYRWAELIHDQLQRATCK